MRRASMVLLALACAALATPAPLALAEKAPRIGEPAPDFELTLFAGDKVRLSELRGNVVVLNFWATWCVPCRTELPTLNAFYEITQKHGLRVFAVTTEDSVPLYKLKPLFEKLAIPAVRRVKGPYAVMGGVPTNYVIDRAGVVRYAKAGALDLDTLNTVLIPLLNEHPPT